LVVTVMGFRWIGEFPATPARLHAPASAQTSARTALASLLRDQTFCFVCVLTFLIFAIRSSTQLNLMPFFAQEELGLSESGIGVMQSLCSLANFFVLWHAGRLLDRIGRRRVTLPALWVTALVLLAFPWATTVPRLVGVSVAFGVVLGYLAPAPAAIVADLAPPGATGAVMGLYRTAGDIGLLLGPAAVGWVAGHLGFGAAFVAAAGCTILVALLGINMRETLASLQGTAEVLPAVEREEVSSEEQPYGVSTPPSAVQPVHHAQVPSPRGRGPG
jgi:MFS family permease